MRILFIGGNGNISWNCSMQALQKGYEVWNLNRGTNSIMRREIPKGVTHIRADISDMNAVRRELDFAQNSKSGAPFFDAIADFICFSPQQAKNSIEMYSKLTRQFIFISTASAYQKPLAAVPITESTPLCNPWWEYSRNKIKCEDIFMEEYRNSGFPITIVRPSHTYDTIIPAAMGSSGWTNTARMLAGKQIVLHGDGTTLWTLTHSKDFARAFTALLGNMAAIGHSFHITSDEWLTWRQISDTVASAAGATPPSYKYITSEEILKRNPELGAGLMGDKTWCGIFDNSKIKKFAPGWQAEIPFSAGIKRTLDWFNETPERKKPNKELDNFLEELCNSGK